MWRKKYQDRNYGVLTHSCQKLHHKTHVIVDDSFLFKTERQDAESRRGRPRRSLSNDHATQIKVKEKVSRQGGIVRVLTLSSPCRSRCHCCCHCRYLLAKCSPCLPNRTKSSQSSCVWPSSLFLSLRLPLTQPPTNINVSKLLRHVKMLKISHNPFWLPHNLHYAWSDVSRMKSTYQILLV